MTRLLLGIAAALMVPALASADIKSSTSASADSGGNYAGPGGVVTTGSAAASVSTSNVSGTSSSTYYVKTDSNGVVYEESGSSSSADVSVSVQATPSETVVETRTGSAPAVRRVIPAAGPAAANIDAGADAHPSTTSEAATASTSNPADTGISLGAQIVLSIQNFFAGLFGWFR